MSTITISKVRNYQGSNSFILSMKQSIERYGSLTQKQIDVVEKIFSSVTSVNVEELPNNLKKIAKYEGPNSFVLDVKKKLLEFGSLSSLQISVAHRQMEKEENKTKVINLNVPTKGQTIQIGRNIGQQLKETYELKFNPILIDITRVTGMSQKAIRFCGKLTIKRGKVCQICARTLTDEFSMLSNVGKLCAKHVGVPYLTNRDDAERFRLEYIKRVDEIGEMEFWIPKSQIKVWDGSSDILLDML